MHLVQRQSVQVRRDGLVCGEYLSYCVCWYFGTLDSVPWWGVCLRVFRAGRLMDGLRETTSVGFLIVNSNSQYPTV